MLYSKRVGSPRVEATVRVISPSLPGTQVRALVMAAFRSIRASYGGITAEVLPTQPLVS